ncbi:MAG TPA: TorF family putative porin [Steroidobacter sp.]|uniref:TorF family putative porin n=1 Tax=Steroidobacter sp. TaxID=1978227 RepID=UPI002ED9BE3C
MQNLRILAALGLMGAAAVANAEVTSTWTLTNDYDFRGYSQSAKDPAIQGSIDYAADSGWYVGAWGSNVDFDSDVDLEVDLYTGFSGESEGGLGYDVGVVYYAYPDDSDLNYFEAYGGISKDWFAGKLWFSNDLGGDDTDGSTEAFYLEANATFPLPQNFSLLAHVGYSWGDYWDEVGDETLDYSIGVGYTLNRFDLALKYVDTDTDVVERGDVFNNEGRVIFTIATTFPWKND